MREGDRKIIEVRERIDDARKIRQNQQSQAHIGSEKEGACIRSSWVCTRSSVDML